jgi:hypothetical protein
LVWQTQVTEGSLQWTPKNKGQSLAKVAKPRTKKARLTSFLQKKLASPEVKAGEPLAKKEMLKWREANLNSYLEEAKGNIEFPMSEIRMLKVRKWWTRAIFDRKRKMKKKRAIQLTTKCLAPARPE